MACVDSNINNCGCTHQHPAECIIYKGENLECIHTTNGDTLDEVLVAINEVICTLSPSGQSITEVEGVSGETTVSSSTVGNITTYTVGLDEDFVQQVEDNSTNISTLSACIATTVKSIVSNTLNVSIDSTNSCGRTIRIESSTPSSVPIVDGIIYSNSDKSEATGGTGVDKVLKTSSTSIGDYETTNGFEIGDEIRWRATGQIHGDAETADVLKFDLFDTPTGILGGGTFYSFSPSIKSSWVMNGTITVLDNTSGNSTLLINAILQRTQTENGIEGNSSRDIYLIDEEVSGVDLTTLVLRIKHERNVSSSLSATNFARQLVVEVRKYIG